MREREKEREKEERTSKQVEDEHHSKLMIFKLTKVLLNITTTKTSIYPVVTY